MDTVNVDIFVLFIFLRYSPFSNICENMYNLKITYIMAHKGNNIKNAKLSPHEIANFHKIFKRIGALDQGSPMSHVDFKKWQCRMSVSLIFSNATC